MKTEMKRTRAGFSLVETLVAALIMSFLLACLFSLNSQIVGVMRRAREETRAAQAAQLEIERLRSGLFGRVARMGQSYQFTASESPILNELAGGQGEIRAVPYPPDNPDDDVLSVSVEITWKSFNGASRSRVVSSLITKYGVL